MDLHADEAYLYVNLLRNIWAGAYLYVNLLGRAPRTGPGLDFQEKWHSLN